MNWIIDFSLKYRPIVLALSIVLIVTGAYSLSQLSIDAFPDVTDVMVQINTVAPALGPLEVEAQITSKIEQTLGGLPRLRLVRSRSQYGLSQVTLVFEDGTDIHFARNVVLERLQSVELPEGMERPRMGPIATGLGEIFHYLVTAPNGDLTDARVIQDWVVKPQLLSVPGVAEVNSWGGFERQFQVILEPEKLLKHRLTIQDILEALEHSNRNIGGGNVTAAGEMLIVTGRGATTTVSEIGGITLKTHQGHAIRLRDVAEVVEGRAPRMGVVTYEGKDEAVLGLGFMLMGENSHEIASRLRKRMENVRAILARDYPGAKVDVVYDRTELVDQVIATVKKNLFEGALLVIAVLFLFLGHFRAALIVALAIPLSMLFAFNAMLQAGVAGTLMSLGAIDFGMVADTSVILIENSVRHLGNDRSGRPVVDIVRDAVKEVRAPTMFGEIIILIVYVPILMLEGVEGKLFKPLALTALFALFGSLVLSLTLMPVLASYLLSRKTAEFKEPWIIEFLRRLYRPVVRFVVDHRVLVLGSALIIFLGTIPTALKLGAIFVPKLNEGSLVLNVWRLPGVSVDESARQSLDLERFLKEKFPNDIRSIWTRTGTPEVATDPMGIEVSDLFIMLTPQGTRRKEKLVAEIDRALRPLPGFNYSFTQPIEMRFNEMISGIRTDVGVKLFGDDFEELKRRGEDVRSILESIPGAVNVFFEPMAGQPYLEVKLDPEALSRYGLHAREVLDLIESVGGKSVGEVRVEKIRLPQAIAFPLADGEAVRNLVYKTPDGQKIPLGSMAGVTPSRDGVQVLFDPEAMSRLGLNPHAVMDWVKAKGGTVSGEIQIEHRRFPLSLRLPDRYLHHPELLQSLVLTAADGQRLPLSKVASVERRSGPMVIHREFGRRRALVTCNVSGRDLGSFVLEAKRKVGEKYADFKFGGQYENLERAAWKLALIVPVCLVLIVLLLYMTYGNFSDAIRIFTGVPLGVVGGVWALYLRDMPFSISAGIGFIALTGISVLDDMVMVSTIRQLMGQGMSVKDAVITGAERRLRPVIMTALLAILGFVPMAVNTSLGCEVQRPLATVVIGGLVSSTLLTLVVVPALYVTFMSRKYGQPSP